MLHELVTRIFEQDRYPEQLYRSCDGLFSLERKTEPERFEKACQMALDCQNYTYRFVMNVLENKMTEAQDTISEKPLPKHNNLRGKEHYKQLELNYNTK